MSDTITPSTDAPVNERYDVERSEQPPTMTLTCRECAGVVTFWNPTDARVAWFAGSHRCGGDCWQEAIVVDFTDDEPIPFTVVAMEVAR